MVGDRHVWFRTPAWCRPTRTLGAAAATTGATFVDLFVRRQQYFHGTAAEFEPERHSGGNLYPHGKCNVRVDDSIDSSYLESAINALFSHFTMLLQSSSSIRLSSISLMHALSSYLSLLGAPGCTSRARSPEPKAVAITQGSPVGHPHGEAIWFYFHRRVALQNRPTCELRPIAPTAAGGS